MYETLEQQQEKQLKKLKGYISTLTLVLALSSVAMAFYFVTTTDTLTQTVYGLIYMLITASLIVANLYFRNNSMAALWLIGTFFWGWHLWAGEPILNQFFKLIWP